MKAKDTGALRLSWRLASARDVPACLRTNPKISGEELLGRSRADGVWRELTCHPAFQSALVETDQPVLGSRVVGFGASVFVQDAFAKEEIERPRRGTAQRILHGIAEGKPALLSQEEIRLHNTIGGINVIILSADVRPDLEAQVSLTERIQPLLANAFLVCQSGYRLRRVLLEVGDPVLRQRVDAMQIWQMREHEETTGGMHSYAGALAYMERSDALRQRESLSALLFNYQEPRLRLTVAEQDLLRAALTGSPDREISNSLGISKETIKTRWLTALRKAEDIAPEIFPQDGNNVVDEGFEPVGRGPQRRHHLMQYLRSNPEELRPFDWAKVARTGSSARPARVTAS